MAIAVGLGAFGAHGLETYLPSKFEDYEKRLTSWDTAVKYHMIHALGIMISGIVAGSFVSRSLAIGCWMFVVGIFLFCGCLYGWVLTDSKPLVMIVPLGGLCFILGWIMFAIALLQSRPEKNV